MLNDIHSFGSAIKDLPRHNLTSSTRSITEKKKSFHANPKSSLSAFISIFLISICLLLIQSPSTSALRVHSHSSSDSTSHLIASGEKMKKQRKPVKVSGETKVRGETHIRGRKVNAEGRLESVLRDDNNVIWSMKANFPTMPAKSTSSSPSSSSLSSSSVSSPSSTPTATATPTSTPAQLSQRDYTPLAVSTTKRTSKRPSPTEVVNKSPDDLLEEILSHLDLGADGGNMKLSWH